MTKRLLTILLLALAPAWIAAQPLHYVVFFERHSAGLDSVAETILRDVAEALQAGTSVIEVRGFADPEGGAPYNRALSLARAEHIAHVLRDLGIAAGRIQVVARGPADFVIDGQESRRVEIRAER